MNPPVDLGLQPELRQISILSNMNMNWFPRITFVRIKEKSETVEDKNNGHNMFNK